MATPVPNSNTAVKHPGPMVVRAIARVGYCRLSLLTPGCEPQPGVLFARWLVLLKSSRTAPRSPESGNVRFWSSPAWCSYPVHCLLRTPLGPPTAHNTIHAEITDNPPWVRGNDSGFFFFFFTDRTYCSALQQTKEQDQLPLSHKGLCLFLQNLYRTLQKGRYCL